MKCGTTLALILGLTVLLGSAAVRGHPGALPRRGAAIRRASLCADRFLAAEGHRSYHLSGRPDRGVDVLQDRASWQVTLRRGEHFRFDCERMRDAWPVALLQ